MQTLNDIFTIISSLHPEEINLSLERIRTLLHKLDHPERRLPPVIQVAGTNGKGSTVAFMRSILRASGYRVHVYTSPHLVRFAERILLNSSPSFLSRPPVPPPPVPPLASVAAATALAMDEAPAFATTSTPASETQLMFSLQRCLEVNQGSPITFFEMTTAAAFLLFAETEADILLLETGLGGRLDATNVAPCPLATVITPVSFDHMDFLGNTLEQIAFEKAGILKPGVTAVIASQPPEVDKVIQDVAYQISSPLKRFNQDFSIEEDEGHLLYKERNSLCEEADFTLALPAPSLKGRHQYVNAACAIAALRSIPFSIPLSAFKKGISTAKWPARLQLLTHGKLVAQAPVESEVWLDGAHNPAGAEILAREMATLQEKDPRPLILILGMKDTKDLPAFLSFFKQLPIEVFALPLPVYWKGISPQKIVSTAKTFGIPSQSQNTINDILSLLKNRSWPQAPRLLITGSLHLAGYILEENGTAVSL